MKRHLLFLIPICLFASAFSSCHHVRGCMDPNSLTFNSEADKDDGSCKYPAVIFYMSVINPSRPVTVSVNGNNVGTITAQYPLGPGNCIAPGCAIYQCTSGQRINWVATEPGGSIWTGSITPGPGSDCLRVRVY